MRKLRLEYFENHYVIVNYLKQLCDFQRKWSHCNPLVISQKKKVELIQSKSHFGRMESEHIFLLWKCFNFIFQLFSLKQTLVLKYTCSIMIISAMMCSTVASCGFPILGNNDIYYRDYTWITILKHTLLRVAFGLIVQGKRLEFNIL